MITKEEFDLTKLSHTQKAALSRVEECLEYDGVFVFMKDLWNNKNINFHKVPIFFTSSDSRDKILKKNTKDGLKTKIGNDLDPYLFSKNSYSGMIYLTTKIFDKVEDFIEIPILSSEQEVLTKENGKFVIYKNINASEGLLSDSSLSYTPEVFSYYLMQSGSIIFTDSDCSIIEEKVKELAKKHPALTFVYEDFLPPYSLSNDRTVNFLLDETIMEAFLLKNLSLNSYDHSLMELEVDEILRKINPYLLRDLDFVKELQSNYLSFLFLERLYSERNNMSEKLLLWGASVSQTIGDGLYSYFDSDITLYLLSKEENFVEVLRFFYDFNDQDYVASLTYDAFRILKENKALALPKNVYTDLFLNEFSFKELYSYFPKFNTIIN